MNYLLGRVVKNTLDADGDLQQVQSKKANDTFRNYANSFNYTAAGAVSSMRLGNGRWENMQFNSRLQPTQIGLGASATDTSSLKLNYEYGELQTNGTVDVLKNNGNIAKQTITVPNAGSNQGFTAVQTYNYDSLNRIKDAKEMIGTTQTWKQTFTYDRYGNRRFDQANTTFPASFANPNITNPTIDTANNRFTTGQGYIYDLSGNLLTDAENRSFVYDAENKQKSASTTSSTIGQYFYDGDGKRIKKVVPSTGETTIFVYDAGGKMVAEYSTVVGPTATAKISYLTNDHLGSPRITTDANGAVVSRRDFLPFGEDIARASYGTDSVRQKFTSYERDNESDLDFAQARYYKPAHGRFTSPDPYKIVAEIRYEKDEEKARAMLNKYISQPQQWNQYVYAINNPLKYTDPSGEEIWLRGTKEEIYEAYGLVMDILGGDGSSTVSEMVTLEDGSLALKLTMSEEAGKKLAARGEGTDNEMLFKGMAEMLTSTTVVEGRIDGNFINLQGKLTDVRRVTNKVGAGYIPLSFSSTNHRQVVISPNSVVLSNDEAKNQTNLSSDGQPLVFTKAMIFAHELGHAWDSMRRHTGDAGALGFENAMRARNKTNNRTRRAEQ